MLMQSISIVPVVGSVADCCIATCMQSGAADFAMVFIVWQVLCISLHGIASLVRCTL